MALNALLLLLVLPIAFVGWRWGPRAAWAAVVVATALMGVRSWAASGEIGAAGFASRVTAFATVAALAGALHLSGQAAAGIPPGPALATLLTTRELEVLAKMAEGRTNAEIADRLVIAESTVKSHVKNILRKLSAANRTEAVCRYCGARQQLEASRTPT